MDLVSKLNSEQNHGLQLFHLFIFNVSNKTGARNRSKMRLRAKLKKKISLFRVALFAPNLYMRIWSYSPALTSWKLIFELGGLITFVPAVSKLIFAF